MRNCTVSFSRRRGVEATRRGVFRHPVGSQREGEPRVQDLLDRVQRQGRPRDGDVRNPFERSIYRRQKSAGVAAWDRDSKPAQNRPEARVIAEAVLAVHPEHDGEVPGEKDRVPVVPRMQIEERDGELGHARRRSPKLAHPSRRRSVASRQPVARAIEHPDGRSGSTIGRPPGGRASDELDARERAQDVIDVFGFPQVVPMGALGRLSPIAPERRPPPGLDFTRVGLE